MPTRPALRLFSWLGVAGALVAAAATPAAAQAPAAELSIFLADTTVAAGGPGVIQESILYASKPVELPGVTLTVDFAGLGGKVDVTEPDGGSRCTSPSASRLVCHDPVGFLVDEFGTSVPFEILLTAAPGAASGDNGTVTLTLAAPGLTPVSDEARVRVGEPVDIAAGPDVEVSKGPGEAFTAPLTVSNPHSTTVDGLNVVFFDDRALRPAAHYRNCTYANGRLRTCAFDTRIGPGETFTATLPYTVAEDAFAPSAAAGEWILMTRAEFEDYVGYLTQNGVDLGSPGDGAELELVAKNGFAPLAVQADVDPENNRTLLLVTITGENGADLAAIGGTLTGAAGDEVTAEIGVVNNGPATFANERSGSEVTLVDLVPPPGTTVVGVPEACFAMSGDRIDRDHPDRTGAGRYRCLPGSTLVAGDSKTFPFRLRIDQVIADAAGTVEVNVPCECEGGFPRDLDLDPTNDKAPLLLNPTSGGGGSQNGGSGQGGGLPVTGTATGLIAGAGAILLLAGVGGYLLARRRRVRFTA